MPKWIGNGKRRHPKEHDQPQYKHEEEDEEEDEEEEEEELHKSCSLGGGVVHQGRTGASSVTSDSGRSMSPEESDSTQQLRLIEDIGPRLDWRRRKRRRAAVAEGQGQGQGQWRRGQMMMTMPCEEKEEETASDAPLDLSISGPLGRKRKMVSSLLLSSRYYDPVARDDEQVKVHAAAAAAAAVRSEADVRLLEEMDRRRRMLSQQNHLNKYGGARWEVGPRHLRLLANSFSTGEKVTRKRHHHHVTIEDEDDDDGEGRGRIPEVHATPEAVAQLERIENKIGEYNCMLCGNHYEDAFKLANHNCSCIVKVVHRCPECNKVFQCPANLASHRRWHGIRGAHLDRSFPPEAPEAAAAAAAAKASPCSTST